MEISDRSSFSKWIHITKSTCRINKGILKLDLLPFDILNPGMMCLFAVGGCLSYGLMGIFILLVVVSNYLLLLLLLLLLF